MFIIVYNSEQRPIKIGPEVGVGGEATIYAVVGHPTLLAKIHTTPPTPDHRKKLAWMQANPPRHVPYTKNHTSIAWPLNLLFDKQGREIGYLMARIQNGVSLLDVYNPRRRVSVLPNFNEPYLYRAARNLAATLSALHPQGYIVGDLNESNVLVNPSAMITLIDTDSFQVEVQQASGPKIYPCPVGKPEYTAPELQGKSFKSTFRQPEHDSFGLGVLIFQLLMRGSHPFRAQWLGEGEPPPLEERIRLGYFPYALENQHPVAPPRHAPLLNVLHPQLAYLMHECFVTGHTSPELRPTPKVWELALARAEKALIACEYGHYYANHLEKCPYCEPTEATKSIAATPSTVSTLPQARPVFPSAPSKKPIHLLPWVWALAAFAVVVVIGGIFIGGVVLFSGRNSTTPIAALPPTRTPLPTFTITPATTATPAPQNLATEPTVPLQVESENTNTPTATPPPTDTPIRPSSTPTPTTPPPNTPTQTSTFTPTSSPTKVATATSLPTNTPTNTATSTPNPTNTPTSTSTATSSPTNTPTNTATVTPSPTNTHTPSPTPRPTQTPTNTATPTPRPTQTPTNTATPTPRPTNTPTNTPSPTPRPTQTPTAQPTNTPTATPTPTMPGIFDTSLSLPARILATLQNLTRLQAALISARPSPTPTPIPTATVQSLPTPSPAATSTPVPAAITEPGITVNLPGGNTYSQGQPIKLTAEVFDAGGIKTVLWWLVLTQGDNRQLLANNTKTCNNATNCVIDTEFTNLAPGQYLINILGQTSQGTSIQTETPITIQ